MVINEQELTTQLNIMIILTYPEKFYDGYYPLLANL